MDKAEAYKSGAGAPVREEKSSKTQTAGSESNGKHSWRVRDYLAYYLVYTVLFAVLAAAVFVWFFLKKRRFVWQTDGVNQHYYGLVYFSRWGKEVLRQWKETGIFRLPTFSLRMGYGEDLYTSLAYYVIGDPFSFPAVFVPEKYLLLFHDLMLLARFWLAGITFSVFCFYMKKSPGPGTEPDGLREVQEEKGLRQGSGKGRSLQKRENNSRIRGTLAGAGFPAVMAGAFIYIFNGFTMSGMRHHYFLNPFVFFPLLLIGCERYFRKKKPGLFIFMVFLTAVSNFYFFYMMVIMTALYVVWRSLRLNGLRHLGRVLLDGIAFLFYGALGVLLSAFIFLPVVLRFLQDPRTADEKSIPFLWPVRFYRNFLDCFLTNGTSALSESWTYMGFGAVAALCVLFIFLQRKKHFDLKAAFVGLTCLLMTPIAGYVLNGFSYPANRWMWAYALLVGYMAATAFPELAEAGGKKLAALAAALFVLAAVCVFWDYTFSRSSSQAFILALFGLGAVLLGRVALLEKREERTESADAADFDPDSAYAANDIRQYRISVRVQALLLVCVMLTIASAGYFDYAPERSAKVFEYLSRAQIETQTAKDAAAARELIDGNLLKKEGKKTPFYRYTTYDPENNTSLLYGVSNTQYYWSLSNSNTARFLAETGQLNRMIHQYDTLDDRTFLNEVAGIRYFLGTDEEGVPFGYEKKEGLSYDNYDLWPDITLPDRYACEVYENRYALPFGFTTDKWISREDYDAMDIPRRQQALMQGILLEKEPVMPVIGTASPGKASTGNIQKISPSFSDQRISAQICYDPIMVTASGVKAVSGSGTDTGNGNAAGKDAGAVAGAAAAVNSSGTVAEAATGNAGAAGTAAAVNSSAAGMEAVTVPAGKGGRISFEVHEAGTVVSLRFQGIAASETGLYLRGMQYQAPAGEDTGTKFLIPVRGAAGEKTAADKQFGFTTPMDPWTTGQTDFLINLRWHEEALDRVDITFPARGTYSFDAMEIVCQPMAEYPAQAQALRAVTLRDLDIHELGESGATDRITGKIDLDSPRILCLQIPRTPGWTAYVDGARTQLLQADTIFSGILLPAGNHTIELRYQTPGLMLGAVISLGTLLLLLAFSIIYTIVSLILRFGERRREAIPAGNYEAVSQPPAENAVKTEEVPGKAAFGRASGAVSQPPAENAVKTEEVPGKAAFGRASGAASQPPAENAVKTEEVPAKVVFRRASGATSKPPAENTVKTEEMNSES